MATLIKNEKTCCDDAEYLELISGINSTFERLIGTLKEHKMGSSELNVWFGYKAFVKSVYEDIKNS